MEFHDGVKVVNTDSFDNPSGPGWGFGAGTIRDGVLEVLGKNWNGLVRERSFRANEGIITDFAYTKGSVFEMLVDSGDWYTDPYKRFGVYMENNYPRVNVWAGKNGLGGANLTGNFIPKPDTTYSLMMVVLPGGEFLAVIWDPSDPAKTVYYHEKVGKNWTNLAWTFKIGADQGKILFDNYREIKFDRLK